MNTAALAAKIDECLKQVRYQYAPNVRKDALQVCSTLPSLTPQVGALRMLEKFCLIFLHRIWRIQASLLASTSWHHSHVLSRIQI